MGRPHCIKKTEGTTAKPVNTFEGDSEYIQVAGALMSVPGGEACSKLVKAYDVTWRGGLMMLKDRSRLATAVQYTLSFILRKTTESTYDAHEISATYGTHIHEYSNQYTLVINANGTDLYTGVLNVQSQN